MPVTFTGTLLSGVSTDALLPYPKFLFASGEQGVWYDPSDFSTMFQDAAGTTAVTGLEQPVGLLLDKSRGLALGSELVSNGDFSNGTTGWTTAVAAGASVSVVSGEAVLTADGATTFSAKLRQNLSLTSGKTYLVEFDVISVTSVCSINLNGEGVTTRQYDFSTTGSKRVYLVAAGGWINISTTFSGSACTIDNISVRELPGNHASQATSASRPVLSARYNLLTRTEDFSNAAWAVTGAGTSKGTTTGTLPNGASGTISTLTFAAVSSVGSFSFAYQNTNQALFNTGVTFSVYARVASGTATVYLNVEDFSVAPSGGNFVASPAITLTSSWQRISVTGTRTSTPGSSIPSIGFDTRASASQTNAAPLTIQVWGADFRVANDGVGIPAYQRVGAATAGSSTAAGTADYDSTGFPPYLRFDGTDDSMATAAIDFTATDKMSVFAGVRKLSDAAAQVVAELSINWTTANGTFVVTAPDSANPQYGIAAKGTSNAFASIATYAAPITNVLTEQMDLAGSTVTDELSARVNGSAVTLTGASGPAGTGNFGNYALYIGSRGGTTLRYNGRLYSLIVRGAASTAAEITNTETWVNGKTKAYA